MGNPLSTEQQDRRRLRSGLRLSQAKNLEDTLRSVLRDELKHITAVPFLQVAETEESPGADVDASILAFLQDLQNE